MADGGLTVPPYPAPMPFRMNANLDPLAPLYDVMVGPYRVTVRQKVTGGLVGFVERTGAVVWKGDYGPVLPLDEVAALACRRAELLIRSGEPRQGIGLIE